jgi:glyoxylase-like metal-dependent hydrolase (beta-lactamase superfamily II)
VRSCYPRSAGSDADAYIDTAFSPAAARPHPTFLCSPRELLALLGVDAAAVPDVILTRGHYDHAGNLDLFPAALSHPSSSTESAGGRGRPGPRGVGTACRFQRRYYVRATTTLHSIGTASPVSST